MLCWANVSQVPVLVREMYTLPAPQHDVYGDEYPTECVKALTHGQDL